MGRRCGTNRSPRNVPMMDSNLPSISSHLRRWQPSQSDHDEPADRGLRRHLSPRGRCETCLRRQVCGRKLMSTRNPPGTGMLRLAARSLWWTAWSACCSGHKEVSAPTGDTARTARPSTARPPAPLPAWRRSEAQACVAFGKLMRALGPPATRVGKRRLWEASISRAFRLTSRPCLGRVALQCPTGRRRSKRSSRSPWPRTTWK
jgi:hypothetical protein